MPGAGSVGTGPQSESATSANSASDCDTTNQPRRRPSRPNSGSDVPSTIGAHRNFSAYGNVQKVRAPIAVTLQPALEVHACVTVVTKTLGTPPANPRTNSTNIVRLP